MKYDPERLTAALDEEERIRLSLRSLYLAYGYARYRMSKFEEYDLYARNKDFLISENIITFTDTNGKLMALKPDVTLSIVKNHKDDPEGLLKLCYNENVYRVTKGSGSFREIPQTGLECIGRVTEREVGEALLLAAKSLALCSPDYMLEVSDLDILSALVGRVTEDPAQQSRIYRLASEKNRHGLSSFCGGEGIPAERLQPLLALLDLCGPANDVMPQLSDFCGENGLQTEYEALRASLGAVCDLCGDADKDGCTQDHILLDFSAVDNLNYYNGVIFRGFLAGLPESVLSGGQYDRLMRRMGRRSKAVGFAVYLDILDRLPAARAAGCSGEGGACHA